MTATASAAEPAFGAVPSLIQAASCACRCCSVRKARADCNLLACTSSCHRDIWEVEREGPGEQQGGDAGMAAVAVGRQCPACHIVQYRSPPTFAGTPHHCKAHNNNETRVGLSF